MRQVLVRYTLKPGQAAENERLIAEVFKELRTKAPEEVRYLVLKLAGDTYLHFAMIADGAAPITTLDAFRTYQSGVKDRCAEQPQVNEGVVVVGNYRALEA